jgi:hypothetical protein
MQNSTFNGRHVLRTSTGGTSRWRRGLNVKYDDSRNTVSADLLDAISEELQKLTDSQWAILAPYFGSSIWCASVSDVCRRVGFNHVHDLDSFIEELVDTFHAQAVTV